MDLSDATALSRVYSFLSHEDQETIIEKVHKEEKSSVVLTAELKHYLSRNHDILRYSIKLNNYGIPHSYSTLVATEQESMAAYEDAETDREKKIVRFMCQVSSPPRAEMRPDATLINGAGRRC